MKSNTFNSRSMAKMAVCVALIAAASYLSFPIPMSPALVTGATCAMGLTALILTPKQTATVIIVYILLGAVGAPVFPGGLSRLLSPVGGFYVSFIVAFTIISMLKGKKIDFKRYLLVSIFPGIPLIYAGGVISMMAMMNIGFSEALAMAVYPFLIGDLIKTVVSCILGVKLNKALN